MLFHGRCIYSNILNIYFKYESYTGCDAVVKLYKTEWYGNKIQVWPTAMNQPDLLDEQGHLSQK